MKVELEQMRIKSVFLMVTPSLNRMEVDAGLVQKVRILLP